MRVNEAMAAELGAAGVGAMFTLVGDETAHFAGHASRQGVRLYTGRHETGTIGMADGYARVGGQVGVAVIARGPGLTNALTSIICATRGGSGVVVVAGDSSLATSRRPPEEALAMDSGHKYVAQERLLDAAMVPSVTLRSPESAAADFAAILARARSGGTLVVNVPQDVMRAQAGTAAATVVLSPGPAETRPAADAVERVATLLASAERPVILAGRGAVRSRADEDLRRLAELSGALLATSLLAKGYFAADPWSVGVAGGLGSPVALELLAEADLVVGFGVSLNPMTMYGGKVFPNARIVQIDSDPGAFGRFSPTDDQVDADARLAAAALARALSDAGHEGVGYRTPEVAARLAGFRIADNVVDEGRPGAIDPRILMLRLDELIPARRTIVVDSGRQLTFPSTYLAAPDASSFIFPHDGGALGAALGVGIGAAIAAPDRLAVVCAGDAALMMSFADFETAVRYRLPMLIVVTNNGGFGGAMVTLGKDGLPDDAARIPGPSFAAVARGLGGDGITVERVEDLEGLPQRLEGLAAPFVLDCRTTSDVVPEWVAFIEGIHRSQASV